jgi:hypothetical protein
MPRPPILPTLDWAAIFNAGLEWSRWIEIGEFPDHRRRMEEDRRSFVLEGPVGAFVAALPKTVHVVAIAEDWCGDVVRHAPVLQAMADRSQGRVVVRYITRADRPDVFVRFVTNGGEAIPKFVFLSERFVECGHWGPMPDACRELISRGKAVGDPGLARKRVSELYAFDAERKDVVRELARLCDIASSTRV